MSKPVLVSSSAPLARVVSSSTSDIFSGDSSSCVEKIKYAFENPHTFPLASNGHRYVFDLGHNWKMNHILL